MDQCYLLTHFLPFLFHRPRNERRLRSVTSSIAFEISSGKLRLVRRCFPDVDWESTRITRNARQTQVTAGGGRGGMNESGQTVQKRMALSQIGGPFSTEGPAFILLSKKMQFQFATRIFFVRGRWPKLAVWKWQPFS